MKKFIKIFYSVIFFGACLLPFAAMPFAGEEVSLENRTLASFPSLMTKDGINTNFLTEAGTYFQDHFAFRNELVTANALLQGRLLGVSAEDGVIEGTDGWLYYYDSLDDYLGRNLLSERSLFNIAHSTAMVQADLDAQNIRFLFTVAANKNSLYGEHMPYYDSLVITEENNLTRLKPLLEKEGVNYLDLKTVFQNQDEVLYHKRDSHWNNKGAALAADEILNALGQEHDPWEGEPYTVQKDFVGDLDAMLYPGAPTAEDEIYYDREHTYSYVEEVESNFDPKITTVCPDGTGSLVMYRDSFGNALLPFIADAYANAYFLRGEPYNLYTDLDTALADTVIMERAERFLPNVAANPPVMPAPIVELGADVLAADAAASIIGGADGPTSIFLEGKSGQTPPIAEQDTNTQDAVELDEKSDKGISEDGINEIVAEPWGIYYQIQGCIDPQYVADDSRIYVRINDNLTYEAFPATLERDGNTCDTAFVMYLYTEELPLEENTAEVIVETDGDFKTVYTGALQGGMVAEEVPDSESESAVGF